MQQAIGDLTEKEKETLRLLLAGHDTKSTAAALGLSVYTINDRLRSARQKLGVTSSREAARILGEAEGGPPQFPAPSSSGMADSDADAPLSGQSKPARLSTRTLAWLAGGIAMIALVTAVAMFALNPAGDARPVATAQAEGEAPATGTALSAEDARIRDTALDWLALGDAGEWDESWQQAGEMFQSQVTAAQWETAATQVRAPLGGVISREIMSVQQTDTLPGTPPGDYAVVQFATAFASAPGSLETVIMRKEDGSFKTVGYFIR
ncbi:helix-turn-helix domain-containing protein [Aurantiacibacter rhizosphaerae]|uniref:DUF4019 domain-containing protein n=1 Tax=Aurantiacibacter rhizosphaerae TaxID=2691582 RepID=A0A844XF11_9SPHN|nr:DUF4019 domain-containing protein [Aurantiacibacter rhizosphaerae]MWV28596.1 DUF4019 domain-containing protein [Aurantiacibacter rhizosphaerae]